MAKTTVQGGASYEEGRVPDDVKAEAEAPGEDADEGDAKPAPRKRAPRKRAEKPTGSG